MEAASRIDRILYSIKWGEKFHNVKQETLPRVCSDHTPIALISGSWMYTKSYFKFEGWWLETDGFNERVKQWWTAFEFEGRPDYILASKLKALKYNLKEWSASTYGNLEKKKKELLNKISDFDSIQQSKPLTEEEAVQKANMVKEFEDYAKEKEIAWRQRSRTLWIKQGDKNTKFFQRTANAHKRINHIAKLVVEGLELVEVADTKREIISFCRKLYSESETWRHPYICALQSAQRNNWKCRNLLKRKRSYLDSRLVP